MTLRILLVAIVALAVVASWREAEWRERYESLERKYGTAEYYLRMLREDLERWRGR